MSNRNRAFCPNSNIQMGIRMAPTVQQGGGSTIQQSIYLSHNNPCGGSLQAFQVILK